ncbi:MAG TPA: endolytic transglycosylase MltG [Patescibacteria group bacterium]|nr:endolytic transglycosylase MltG [Patescibacteria group bacterium]
MRWVAAVIVLGVVVAVAGAGGWLAYQWQSPYQGYRGKSAVVDIQRGTTTREIGKQFEQAGVVRSAMAFELWSRLHPREKLEAGEYRFDQAMTPPQVFEMVAQGRVWTVTLTVPEGWTMFDIADAVERDGLANRTAFLRAARDTSLIHNLAPDVPTLEGFLFPATYQFPHRTTAQAVAREMVARFRQAWANLTRNGALPPSLTPEQVVTLASLVEEETPNPAEKPIIAGVFMNRLRLGYPLECDPSVVYALKLAGRYQGQLHAPEMGFHSPYNTYLHYGLPPGPIGNPGMASLKAALEPAHTGYLYFVADGRGGHAFSRTLAEHRRNVARYRELVAAKKKEDLVQRRQQGPVATHDHHAGSETHP